MRILVTGATGFIGRHLLPRLAAEHEVYGLVRRVPTNPVAGVQYVAQELTEPLDVDRLPTKLDAVIHQAALIEADTATQGKPGGDAAPFLANVVATWRLLRYAETVGVSTFIHASTGGVYGCRDHPFVESDVLNPMDLYSLTKSQAELAIRHTPTSFPKIILRYFFPYGMGTPNPIPSYVERAVRGEPIALNVTRKPNFNPIHIDDTIEATVRALSLSQDCALNIAGIETTSFAAIAEFAALRVGRQAEFRWLAEDEVIPYYRADLVADVSAMRETLAFTPQVSLETGLSGLVDAYVREGNAIRPA